MCVSFPVDRGANQTPLPDVLAREANMQSFKEDKDRFLVLHYVKTNTILGFQSFDWMEEAERRLTMDLMNHGHFRMEMLNSARVRACLRKDGVNNCFVLHNDTVGLIFFCWMSSFWMSVYDLTWRKYESGPLQKTTA